MSIAGAQFTAYKPNIMDDMLLGIDIFGCFIEKMRSQKYASGKMGWKHVNGRKLLVKERRIGKKVDGADVIIVFGLNCEKQIYLKGKFNGPRMTSH